MTFETDKRNCRGGRTLFNSWQHIHWSLQYSRDALATANQDKQAHTGIVIKGKDPRRD